MSDTPQGEGWWQASDLKWYPPSPDRTRRWILPGAVITIVAVVAATVAFLVIPTSDEADASVLMEPVTTAGPDPFMASVTIAEITEFPDTVEAVVATTAGTLDADPATGTLTATGDAPGLYGGTRDDAACDTDTLTAFLTDPDNAAQTEAFATTIGIGDADLTTYLDALTPTLLTLDTRVTNHGYRDGRATPRQSVLQAGTAVLVDDLGVPVVRCSCGNPLTDPEPLDLTTATTTGTTWTTWTPARTTTPTPAPRPQTTLTLLDITTGDTYQQPTGPTDATNWIAVGGGFGGPDVELPGSIHRSDDGVEWEQVFESDGGIHGVAHGNGTYVAVGFTGRADGSGVEPTGFVHTSTDGTDWTEAQSLPIPAKAVAFGNGTFVAISDHEAIVSDNGADWSDPVTLWEDLGYGDYGAVSTITFGDGTFLAFKHRCGANCHGQRAFSLVSEDGFTWEKETNAPGTGNAATPYGSLELLSYVAAGFNEGFGVLGARMLEGSTAMNPLSEPTSARLIDGAWQLSTIAPMQDEIRRLGTANGSWIAVSAPEGTQSSILVSDDLITWSALATLDTVLSDVLVVGEVEPASNPEAEEPEPTTTDVELTEAGFRVGGEEYSTASSPASAARAALTDALGEPGSATPIGSGVCEPGMYSWGELELIEFSESYWYFSLGSPNVAGEPVAARVRTDGDVGLGDTIDAYRSAHPSTVMIETEWGDTAYWADSDGDGRGLLAFASDGRTVTSLSGGAEDPTFIADC